MTPTALLGQGTTWACGSYGMAITDVSFTGASLETFDASNMNLPTGDFIPFITSKNADPGEIELSGELTGFPTLDGNAVAFTCVPAGKTAYTIAGTCVCVGWTATIPHRGKMTSTMRFKIVTLTDTGSGYYWY
jgi:hypothetical protein